MARLHRLSVNSKQQRCGKHFKLFQIIKLTFYKAPLHKETIFTFYFSPNKLEYLFNCNVSYRITLSSGNWTPLRAPNPPRYCYNTDWQWQPASFSVTSLAPRCYQATIFYYTMVDFCTLFCSDCLNIFIY